MYLPFHKRTLNCTTRFFYDKTIANFINIKVENLSLRELKYFEAILICSASHKTLLLTEPFFMLEPLHKIEF